MDHDVIFQVANNSNVFALIALEIQDTLRKSNHLEISGQTPYT